MINKQQPLDLIEKYFGVEIGTYFVWMGFYNRMLIVAAIFGIATSIYSVVSYTFLDYIPV